jgi:hypothetical protein
MVLAAIAVPALSWWVSLRYYHASKQAEGVVSAKQDDKAHTSEVIRKLEDLKKKYVDVSQQNEELKKWIAERKQKRDPLLRQSLPLDSLEFAKKPLRSTWTGHTDPDSVWHDQRARANQTLIEHGLPTLDGRGSFPDSPSLPQRPRAGNGQK